MTEVLPVVVRAISEIRPDLGENPGSITRESALFYAGEPGRPVLGLDSMEALELLVVLEREFGVELADTGIRIGDLQTVGDVVDALGGAAGGARAGAVSGAAGGALPETL
ncbi:acyl carrier protein [Kitasatospora sp. NPDC059722]|uniref:acyl carrier protein n=1 Tax=Kitasatospora sp. NPDC059722 TaxID=3346925 RepID=UPI00367ED467